MMDQVFVFGSFTEDEAVKNAAPPPKPQKVAAPPTKLTAPTKAATPATKATTPRASSNGLKPNGHVERVPRTGQSHPAQSQAQAQPHAQSQAQAQAVQVQVQVQTQAQAHQAHAQAQAQAHAQPVGKPQASPRNVESGFKPVSSESQPVPEVEKSWAAMVKVQPDSTRYSRKPVARPAEATKEATKPGSSGFRPRGLINTGNICFLNSTLQALLSCPPFCELLRTLNPEALSEDKFPLLHAFATFATEIENDDSPYTEKYTRKGEDEGKNQGIKPLIPSMFNPILLTFSPQQEARGRQEDAQEFLGYLMNQMHDELIKLDGRGNNASLSVADEGEWETVGPKNKTAITRTYSFVASPLSEIFGGQQDSFVKAKGSKVSATSEPFYLLHLDIISDSVHSVEDALKVYGASTTVEYRSATGKTEDASKYMRLSSLPKVLILHLMRFSYGENGTWKLHKAIRYPAQLNLGKDLLKEHFQEKNYELVATITHHGHEPSGGHYTADTKLPDNTWLRFDDRNVCKVGLKQVFSDEAYVLFYRRLP